MHALNYFQNRALAKEKEPSVHKVFGQAYIFFFTEKALHVMLALRDLIGEEKVTSVLRKTDKTNLDTPVNCW